MLTVQTQHERITDGTVKILSASKALAGRYGMNYLIDILRGTPRFGLREDSHAELPEYASMDGSSPDYLRRLIRLLIRESFLEIVDHRFGLIGVTLSGEEYLQEPTNAVLHPSGMKMNALDRELERRLRELRRSFAEKEGKPPFRVFTDFCLQGLIDLKPISLAELLEVPGIGPGKANLYGPALVACIQNLEENKDLFYQERLHQKATRPAHQAVRALFEAGFSLEQMAEKRNVKTDTIRQILYTLHQAGQIDLRPWIEEQVSEEELEAGTTWFLNQESQRLRDAYEEVGLDYDILRLCKLYVSDVKSAAQELAQAS